MPVERSNDSDRADDGGLDLALPADLPSFLDRFATERACRDHLFTLRWPGGWRCPGCGGTRHYRLETRPTIECANCGAQQSLYAGTLFEQTKTPLRTWFLAIHLFLSSKGGVSSLELKRQLGFGSDQTAWVWLTKLRRALSVRGAPLEGPVEVDETMLGGPEPGKRGRGAAGKTLVAGAVEVRTAKVVAPDPEQLCGAARQIAVAMAERLSETPQLRRCLARARLAGVANASAEALGVFIAKAVAPSAAVATDGWAAYRKASGKREHTRHVVGAGGRAHEHLPAIHLLFTLLKRLLTGTYHGGVGRHLAGYLDEFVFRFNRKSLSPFERTFAGITRAADTPPLTIEMIFQRT